MERIKKYRIKDRQWRDVKKWRNGLFLILAAFMMVASMSCTAPQVQKSQATGVYHVVKKGETAYSIARAYSISLQELAEINNIQDVSNIKEGVVIFIPNADRVIDDIFNQTQKKEYGASRDEAINNSSDPGKQIQKKDTTDKRPVSGIPETHEQSAMAPAVTPKVSEKPPSSEKPEEAKIEKGLFIWPLKGVVKSRFGVQPNKTYHNWIKLSCAAGEKVKASSSGTVIYSASLKDFGETIIIRHPNEYATVYTHLKKRQVKADQSVRKGDFIAVAGQKDDTGDTYVNFEIRYRGKAVNPILYLP